jgi:hypothetical protein
MSEEAVAPEAPAQEVAEQAPAEPASSEPSADWREQIDTMLAKKQAEQDAADAEAELAKEGEAAEQPRVSWDDVISRQEPDVQQLMKQLRAESTRRFQDAADLKRQAEAERAALFDSPLFKQLQDVASQDAEVDPFDPKSFETYIEKKVAERLQSVLQPVKQAHQQAQAQQGYQAFMQENPDLQSDPGLRKDVATLLRTNESMSLEHAYHVVKGQRAVQAERETAQRRARERRAAKAAALRVTAAPTRGTAPPKADLTGKSAHEIYNLLMNARG